MTDYQKQADEHARKARLSPHYWTSKVQDDFVDWFMEVCEARKISVEDLATLIKLKKKRVKRMINGYDDATLTEIQSIAVALGYRVDSMTIKRLDAPREG